MCFHPNKGFEVSELMRAKGACYDHRNSLSSNFASSLLDVISYLGGRTPQLCRILPLCHIPQRSTSASLCQGAARSRAAASSSVLQQLPEAGTCLGQLLGTNGKGFCNLQNFVNLQLLNGKIEACQKDKSSSFLPLVQIQFCQSLWQYQGLVFSFHYFRSNEGNHPKAVYLRAVLRGHFLLHYPKNGSF